MGVNLEKKTLELELGLELCQALVVILQNMLNFTVFLYVAKIIFVRKCNPIGT